MAEHGNTVESSESIFAEALGAAMGTPVETTSETNESVDLQDTSFEETSGIEADAEVNEVKTVSVGILRSISRTLNV